MKYYLTILLCICSAMTLWAQPDRSFLPLPPGDLTPPTALPNPNQALDAAPLTPKKEFDFNTQRPSLIQPKNNFNMTKDYGFAKPTYEYKPAWLEKDNEIQNEYYKDKYFGDFRAKTSTVYLYCRDHMYVDGDRVRVFLNDVIIEYDIFLVSEHKEIKLELKPGLNKIEVIALNQGTSGPNTAEFLVVDENGDQILKNIWNLATGVKASFMLVQQ